MLAPATTLELGGEKMRNTKHTTRKQKSLFSNKENKEKRVGEVQWRNEGDTMLDWIVSFNLKWARYLLIPINKDKLQHEFRFKNRLKPITEIEEEKKTGIKLQGRR
jgi:hypothetical protein